MAIVDLLVKNICDGIDLPYEWITNMPLTTEIIRPLVEKCRGCLPSLLVSLGEMRFVRIGIGKPLIVQDMQRILKVARNTDDPKTLEGAFIALSNSRFLRIAKTNLILKLIRIDSSKAHFVIPLFRRHSRTEETFGEETEVIREIAKGVLNSPDSYAFAIVSAAADFLAEDDLPTLQPLLNMEGVLGITMDQVSPAS